MTLVIIATALLFEWWLRQRWPSLGQDFIDEQPKESPFLYDKTIGYEIKPHAKLAAPFWREAHDESVPIVIETMNADGFRNSEIPLEKGRRIRFAAMGDSIVQSRSVPAVYSWEKQLEELIPNSEVINAGVGGYVSWQVTERFKKRVAKYKPDYILVAVGWNDLVFSSLPNWTPKLNLADIQNKDSNTFSESLLRRLYREATKRSYLLRLARNFRLKANERRLVHELVKERNAKTLTFNEEALQDYRNNLEDLYETIRPTGAKMILITCPSLLSDDNLNHDKTHLHLKLYYQSFSFSAKDYHTWQGRYVSIQRELAKTIPEILLIDAYKAFLDIPSSERFAFFSDLVHLTKKGNSKLAQLIAKELNAFTQRFSEAKEWTPPLEALL